MDETSITSFIGFRVKVCKERFTYESKSLLLFLKNSEKAIFYSINNNRIHVQCGTNAWELFYLLYDDYLRKYVLTIIGTRFFYHFVYSYCIEKEKQFLKQLCKGSKVIRVSKSSIYYKIHRKCKISVTDMIHMTLNMPKRKKYTLSSFDFRESLLYSDREYGDFYTNAGNKINFSKLMLTKLKTKDVSEKSCQKIKSTDVNHKRKFGDVETNQNLELNKSSKYFKLSESCSSEKEWKQYQSLKSFSVQNFSTISFINTLVPNLLKSENSSCNSNVPSIKTHLNINLPSSSSNTKEDELKTSAIVHKACALENHEETDIYENSENLIEKSSLHGNKSVTYSECVTPKVFLSHHSISISNHESLPCANNSDVTRSCDINSNHFSTSIKDNDNLATKENVNFSTAADKVINISSAAMLKVHKLCEKEQIMAEKITNDVVIQKVPEKNTINTVKHEVSEKNYADLKRESVNKDTTLPKKIHSFIKSDAHMPKKLAPAYLSLTKNLKQDNFDITEDVTFSTAAGERINVSNDAMKAAQKLIYSSSDEDKMPLSRESLSVQINHSYKNEITNGCTSKADDIDMDNTLVEKFFEDVQFDEKDLQLTKDNIKQDNLRIITEPNSDKSLPTRKPRKSLGGRRNMRYCSDKL